MSHKTAFVGKDEPFDHSPNSIVVGEQPLTTNFAPSTETCLTNPPSSACTSAVNNFAKLPLKASKRNPSSPINPNFPRPSCKSIKIRPYPIVASTGDANNQAKAFPPLGAQSVPCKLRVKAPPNNDIQSRPHETNGNQRSAVNPPSSAHNNLNEFADLACEVARVHQANLRAPPRMQQTFPNHHPRMQRARPTAPPAPPLSVYPPPPLHFSVSPAPHPATPAPLTVLGKRPHATTLPNVAPQPNVVRTHQFDNASQQRAMAQAVAERSLRTMAAAAGCQAARDAATCAVRMRLEADNVAVRARMESLLRMTGDNVVLRSGLEGVLGEVEMMKEKMVREVGGLYYEIGELREGLRGMQEMLGMRSRRNDEYWRRGNVDTTMRIGVEVGAGERMELERCGVDSPGGGIGSDVSGGAVAVGVDEGYGEGDEEARTKRRKTRSNGVAKRRRDNWTATENDDFLRLVHENEGMDEMELRRMLAKHFAPRRTHEQCANHLRILRAQNKVPPAVGEAIVYPRKVER